MRTTLAALAAAFAIALAASVARAGDTAEAQVLGFAGELFAFEEYGVQDGSGFPYSNIYVVDIADNSWISGTPIRITLQTDGASLAQARADARARLRERFGTRFDTAGFTLLAHSPLGEVEADPVRQAFAPVLPAVPLGTPATRYVARLDIYYADARTEGCVQVMGDRPMGFRLVVEREDGGEAVLSEDETIPRSRGCPITYRISQIVTDRPWQPETVAVLISVFSPGFEGPQRRFVAVTGRLPNEPGPNGSPLACAKGRRVILRGQLVRFAGDPFAGEPCLIHETDGALVVENGMIAAVGPAKAVLADRPGAEVRRTQHLIAPGFVDCHMHYPQIGIIASYGAQLLDWLTRYTFPEEARFADPEHAARAARASFDEQLRHGVTTSASYCTIHPGSVDAYFTEAERRGVRAIAGKVMMDRNAPPALCDTARSAHDDSAALIARWHGRGRAVYAISPRFAPTSTAAQLEAAGALWAAHPDCLMQTHLDENPREIAWVEELFPEAPDYLGVYERYGLAGPGAVFGHAIHLTPRERRALAGRGASVAHCPTSNQFLGSGECDVAGLAGDGVRVGLASDTGGGTSFSPFATMRAAYEVAQRRGHSMPPAHLWWLATLGSARALHQEHRVGTLAPGLEADFVLLDTAATPLLAQRTGRAETIDEVLFALAILADDRAVAETWSGGRLVRAREVGEGASASARQP